MMPDPRHDLTAVLLLAILALAALRWAYAPGGALDAAHAYDASRRP